MPRPIPSVPMDGNYRKFATDLVAYLRSLEQELSAKQVTPGYWTPDAKAARDGVIMWNREADALVVAIGKDWIPLYAGAAFGAMRYAGTGISGPDITQQWQTVMPFDTVNIPPYNMAFDTTNNWIIPLTSGLFMVNVFASLRHNSSGASSRELDFRLRNIDNGNISPGARVPTGQTDRTTTYAQTFLFLVPPTSIGLRTILEVSAPNGDYSNITWEGAALSAARINFVGDLP